MNNDIKIRYAQEKDIEGIVELINRAFGDSFALLYRHRYHWFFKNPYLSSDTSPVWIATHNGKTIGHMIVCPIEFIANKNRVLGHFNADLAVDPNFRRKGIAKRIYKAALEKCHLILSASSTSVGGSLEESVGFKNFLNLPRFFKILRPEAYIHKSFCWIPGIDIPLRWYYRNRKEKHLSNGVSVFDIKKDMPLLNSCVEKTLKEYDIGMFRSAQYFSWRYLDIPDRSYKVLAAKENGDLCGYIVYRVIIRNGRKVGRICDFISTELTAEWLDKLLSAAERDLYEDGCTAIEAYVEASPPLKAVFKSHGFRHQEKATIDFRLYCRDQAIRESTTDPTSSWFLTCSDVDIDLT